MIAALGYMWQNWDPPHPYCGRRVRIKNTGTCPGKDKCDHTVAGVGNEIEVTVVDSCNDCTREWIDLSRGAWAKLTNNNRESAAGVEW